jgi:hypothetical protein
MEPGTCHSTGEVDGESDWSQDEPEEAPMRGSRLMKEGKWGKSANRLSYAAIYQEKKDYIKWIRSHINTSSGEEMKMFALYIELRDSKKAERLATKSRRSVKEVFQLEEMTSRMIRDALGQWYPRKRTTPTAGESDMEDATSETEWSTIGEAQAKDTKANRVRMTFTVPAVQDTEIEIWTHNKKFIAKMMAYMVTESEKEKGKGTSAGSDRPRRS